MAARNAPPLGAQAETAGEADKSRSNGADHATPRRRSRGVENSIARAPAPERSKEGASTAKGSDAPNEVKKGLDEGSRAMPGHIATRYVVVDNKYHFPNTGSPAFIDYANRLTTRLENTEVISDLIAIAKERNWNNIAIAGTKTFKAEAWQQANLAGLTVRNYRPSKLEEAMLERRRGREEESQPAGTTEVSPGARPPERATPINAEAAHQSAHVPVKDGVYTGKLLERGRGRAPDDPSGNPVPYLKIRTGKSEKVLWGDDLERAVDQSKSQVKLGDEVTARFGGPTVRSRPVLDGKGGVVREERVDPNQTWWSVESTEFLRERADLAKAIRDPDLNKEAAVRKYPSLAGAYTELREGEIKAIQQFKVVEDRVRFLARMRERLAEGIERGEPLPVTRVKPRAQMQSPNPPKARDLVQERVLG
jgi:Large polyvalent protein-associated domain 7